MADEPDPAAAQPAPPAPKADPAPPAADQAGELKAIRAELDALRKVVSEMPESFAKILADQMPAPPPPPTRKPLPGFKPGVFKGR